MKLLLRIVITVIATLGAIYVMTRWIAPVAFSYYMARTAPALVRIVPTALPNLSISDAAGTKLSYVGYGFEVPWTDLDESQTKLYSNKKGEKSVVDLRFKSGLRMKVTAMPANEFIDAIAEEFKVSRQKLERFLGHEATKSDYSFNKRLYEFTPDKMSHWDFRRGVLSRDEFLLMIKSIVLSSSAVSGIYNIQTQNFVGFQQGNPEQTQTHGIIVTLYSDRGAVEMIFAQKDYRKTLGITQPEINRIICSLRSVQQQDMQVQAHLVQ